MDAATFIASIVGSLAWPAAAVALAIIARKPVLAALEGRKLRALRAGKGQWEFEFEQLQEVQQKLLPAGEGTELDQTTLDLIESRPSQAIGACWDSVVAAIDAAGKKHVREWYSIGGGEHMVRKLAGEGVVDPAIVRAVLALHDAQGLYPRTHATKEQARRYAETAHTVIRAIQSDADGYPKRKKKAA